MALAARIGISAGALAVGGGALLWLHYGSLVYFDTLASAFVGCFF